jgi:hypothetical protein
LRSHSRARGNNEPERELPPEMYAVFCKQKPICSTPSSNMNTHIYLNFLKEDQLHAGVNLGNSTIFARSENIKDNSIVAFVDIHLRDSVPNTLEMFYRVIEEGFKIIGTPQEAHVYREDTKTGRFEFLTRQPYPNNAEKVKAYIAKVFELTNGNVGTPSVK